MGALKIIGACILIMVVAVLILNGIEQLRTP